MSYGNSSVMANDRNFNILPLLATISISLTMLRMQGTNNMGITIITMWTGYPGCLVISQPRTGKACPCIPIHNGQRARSGRTIKERSFVATEELPWDIHCLILVSENAAPEFLIRRCGGRPENHGVSFWAGKQLVDEIVMFAIIGQATTKLRLKPQMPCFLLGLHRYDIKGNITQGDFYASGCGLL